jgi:hypothetical protein
MSMSRSNALHRGVGGVSAMAILDQRAGAASDTNCWISSSIGSCSIAILVFMVRFSAICPERARKAASVAEEPQPQPMDAPRPPSTGA